MNNRVLLKGHAIGTTVATVSPIGAPFLVLCARTVWLTNLSYAMSVKLHWAII